MCSYGKIQDAVVVPLNTGWSDIGSWSALWDIDEKDDKKNAIRRDTIGVDYRSVMRLIFTVLGITFTPKILMLFSP